MLNNLTVSKYKLCVKDILTLAAYPSKVGFQSNHTNVKISTYYSPSLLPNFDMCMPFEREVIGQLLP